MKNIQLTLGLSLGLSFGGLAPAGQSVTATGQDPSRFAHLPESELLRGRDGEILGSVHDPEAALGGTFGNPFALQLQASVQGRGLYSYTINGAQIPGSNWDEEFLVGIPENPVVPTPVLVLFHGYGETPQRVLERSDLIERGMRRGWIVVTPLGAHIYNYGIEYSQLNVEAAINMLAGTIAPSFGLTVDADRFYAVGFSMGGGAAASFAARHVDHDGLRFAALAVHTGSTALPYTYWSTPGAQSLFRSALMFGADPSNPNARFEYLRASSVDLPYPKGKVDQTTDMVRNLSHIPVLNYFVNGDINANLLAMTRASHRQLRKNRLGDSTLRTRHGRKHRWHTLNERWVLNRLEPHQYQPPTALTRTLADRDGDWHCFNITQASNGSFSPLYWVVDPPNNRFIAGEIANITRLSMPLPTGSGLDPTTTFEVLVDSANNVPFEVVIGEIGSSPISVLRNGVGTPNWSYDALSQELTLYEDTSGVYPRWTIN